MPKAPDTRELDAGVGREVHTGGHSFFPRFQIESFTTHEVQASLRAAMGMWPAQSVAGARQTLREAGQPGRCPACEAAAFGAQRARGVLLDSLPVEETARKYAWAYRHEPSGPEHDAWTRAFALVDGRVFEGGPAR